MMSKIHNRSTTPYTLSMRRLRIKLQFSAPQVIVALPYP